MKRWVSVLLLLLFVSIPIVIERDQNDLIRELSAKEDGFNRIETETDEARQGLNICNIK